MPPVGEITPYPGYVTGLTPFYAQEEMLLIYAGNNNTQGRKNYLSAKHYIPAVFGFLLLNAEYFRFQAIALGVIQELFTIPVIVGQFVLLYFAWKKFKLSGYSLRTYAFASTIIVTGLICFVLVTFLLK